MRFVVKIGLKCMKPVEKKATPSSGKQSSTLRAIVKKVNPPAPGDFFSSDPTAEYIVAPERHLTPAMRARLEAHSIRLQADENLLARLWRLETENDHLKSLTITDELTGLYNRRFFNRQMSIEIARTRRTGEPFCLAFIDLDNFKAVNDTLGHAKGDEFLVKICRKMTAVIRPTDFACRFGGDEFAVILPATSLRDGVVIARRWHQMIVQIADQMRLPVSSSIGLDEFDASCKLSAEEFQRRVDEYLYEAKRTGKGKIAHPKVEIPEVQSVSWAEKEILYHIFQPSVFAKKTPKAPRGKK